MADVKNLVKIVLDSRANRVAGNYSVDDSMEVLQKALVEANNGSTKLDYKKIRDGECKGLFSIVETIITKVVVEGLPESCPLFDFVESRNIKDGDTNIFVIKDNCVFVVADIAHGTQGLRRQRLTGGEEYTVKTRLKGIKIYEELRRVLAGRIDFNELIDKVAEAFQRQIREDMYEAVVGAFENTVAPYTNAVAGSFDEATLVEIIDHVEAATGMKAKILGSKQAVRKITGVRGADANSAKEDLYSMGYFGHFYTTPIIVMENGHKPGTTEFILKDDLYIVAGDDKFIKFVTEGETLIIPGETFHNSDLSQEYLMAMGYGVRAEIASVIGCYRLS